MDVISKLVRLAKLDLEIRLNFRSPLKISTLSEGGFAFNESSPAPMTPESFRSLVLNSSYQPVKMICWQKALILWFQGKVEILEYHAFQVRSSQESFRLPSVMRLKRYVSPRRPTRLKFSRENVYLRDNYTCQYCGTRFHPKDLTLDHVVPASKLGRKDWTNMVTACQKCNHRKGNRTPIGAGMPLLCEPRIPTWLPATEPAFNVGEVPETWLAYLVSSA